MSLRPKILPLDDIQQPQAPDYDIVQALELIEPDPHFREDELENPIPSNYQYPPMQTKVKSLEVFADYSDEVYNDYMMRKLRGEQVKMPTVADIDTDPDYDKFVRYALDNQTQMDMLYNERKDINTESEIIRLLKGDLEDRKKERENIKP